MITTNVEDIKRYFLNFKKQSEVLALISDYFESRNIEFGFLGGAVRAAINHSRILPRDFDIVFDSNDMDFDSVLRVNEIDFKLNSFGGRKIYDENFVFDVWSLSKHHLIAEQKYNKSFYNIPKTTFVNYDSIFFDYTKKKIIGKYFECEENKIIDFVGNKKNIESNFNKNVSICKLALLNNRGYSFSKKLDDYISTYLKTFFDTESLFDIKTFFECFVYSYNRHCNFELDIKTKKIIYNFVINYLEKK